MSEWLVYFTDLLEYRQWLLEGLGHTLILTAIVTLTGLLGGILVFYLTLSHRPWVRRLIEGYISFFIGMPLIVLLFLMYYGLPQWGLQLSPLLVAVIGFTLNVSAYNARYLRSAYNGLDQAEIECARAQGFSDLQVFRYLILPQSLRLSVPALTNQAILNLKDSSVAFLIQYAEFFARIQELATQSFLYFKAYLTAGLVYLGLVSVMVLIARRIEKRALRRMI
jgi:polar amino acid transport system permease protein